MINTVSINTTADPHPVIARTNTQEQTNWDRPQLLAVWEGISGLRRRTADGETNGGWTWDPLGDQELAPSGNRNPSLSSPYLDYGSTRPFVYITYDDSHDVFLRPYGGNWTYGVETVPASIATFAYRSQVAAKSQGTYPTQHEVHIVWESQFAEPETNPQEILAPEAPRVVYQAKIGGTWGAVQEWSSSIYNYKRPSVVNLSTGNVIVTWDNGSSVYRSTKQGGVWSTPVVEGSGIHANLVQGGTSGLLGQARYAAMGTSGPLFAVQVSGPYAHPQLVLSEQYSRRVVAARMRSLDIPLDTTAYCAVEFSSVSLKLTDGTVVPLPFSQVYDSLPGFSGDNAWSHLATEPVIILPTVDSIVIDGTANVFAPIGLFGLGDIGLRLNFELVDARDSSVIRRLGSERVFSRDTLSLLNVRERLNGLAGGEVFVRPTLTGIAKRRKNIVYTLVHVHTVIEDSALQLRTIAGTTAQQTPVVPTVYSLHQNYPNPFNPSTVIRYQLPEDVYVSLKVYDLLGREVTTLVDEAKEAGYYEATFDASSLGSGVYFYRMQAGNYNAVRKLLVVK